MYDALDKTLLKKLKIFVNVFVSAWMISFVYFLYVISFIVEGWYQEPVLIWPFIHTIFICIAKENTDSDRGSKIRSD